MTFGVAGATKPTITAGNGGAVNCTVSGALKLSEPLKDNWTQSDHSTDADPAVQAIPDTQFAADGTEIISGKGRGTCSGYTGGAVSAAITSMRFTVTTDVGEAGDAVEATCGAWIDGIPPDGDGATYVTTVTWGSPTAQITPTEIASPLFIGTGFSGVAPPLGGIGGSFESSGGGVAGAAFRADPTTLSAISQAPPTSSDPVPAYRQCQPSLTIKTAKSGSTAQLVNPKGLRRISISGTFSLNGGVNGHPG
jgi:hypothetical protein